MALKNNTIISSFIQHYDSLVGNFTKPGNHVATANSDAFYSSLPAGSLDPDGLPEPYFGDLDNYSAVLLNLNPAQTIITNSIHNATTPGNVINDYGLASNTYNSMAVQFPYLNPGYYSNPGFLTLRTLISGKTSVSWWNARKEWVDRIVNAYHKTTGPNPLNPYALELCPWHSLHWPKNIKWSNSTIRNYVNAYCIKPAYLLTANHSNFKNVKGILPFGLFIGSNILHAMEAIVGSNNCTIVHQWDHTNWSSPTTPWPTHSNGNRKNHTYVLVRCNLNSLLQPGELEYLPESENRYIYFLGTWYQGGYEAPTSEFQDVENEICDAIKPLI